ncbi:MAG: hypothetical protein VKK42_20785 [Lyngbya sp.]|nr:hypothetical protein [Lyngbya sp.]
MIESDSVNSYKGVLTTGLSITQSKQKAEESLAVYGFQIGKSINNRDYPSLFQMLQFNQEDTELLFGKDSSGKHVVSKRGSVLKG